MAGHADEQDDMEERLLRSMEQAVGIVEGTAGPSREYDLPRTSRIKAPEAAGLLGIPLHSLYRFTRAGLVPHFRIGRSVRYDRAALEAFIANGGTQYGPR